VFVYVLNCHGQPLMPCQPRKARLLLKEGKAKVMKMSPGTSTKPQTQPGAFSFLLARRSARPGAFAAPGLEKFGN